MRRIAIGLAVAALALSVTAKSAAAHPTLLPPRSRLAATQATASW